MSDRNSDAAIRAMIEHGLREDADVNEQCLAENARALLEELEQMRANQWYMRNVLAEYGLNDLADDTPFPTQLREKLAARDAAQQRDRAVKELRHLAKCLEEKATDLKQNAALLFSWGMMVTQYHERADAIESGEVALW